MLDQWYFDIGDGQTYGPFPLEKLQKWAESGNLMPTHRVRNVESEEWIIAAYVPGLEQTTVVPDQTGDSAHHEAAKRKNAGERVDLLAGQAKLFASEACWEVTQEALRIHGGNGYANEYDIERLYRDAPLMIVGEGTSEIQKLVIARQLLKENR